MALLPKLGSSEYFPCKAIQIGKERETRFGIWFRVSPHSHAATPRSHNSSFQSAPGSSGTRTST